MNIKTYRALLTQTGENDPIATVLENNLGPIAWSRNVAGEFYGTLLGGFEDGKTFLLIDNFSINLGEFTNFIYRQSADRVVIGSSIGSDDGLLNTAVEIIVYP